MDKLLLDNQEEDVTEKDDKSEFKNMVKEEPKSANNVESLI